MDLKVSKWSLIVFLCSLIMFFPLCFTNEFVRLMSNLLAVIVTLILIRHKYKPSVVVFFIYLISIYRVAISFYNQTEMADYHIVLSSIKACLFISCIDLACRNNPNGTWSAALIPLLAFVVLDAGSVILYPDGLFANQNISSNVAELRAEWIYGNKNNRILYYFLAVLLLLFKDDHKLNENARRKALALSVLSCIIMILVKSSTSIFVFIVVTLALLLANQRGVLAKSRIHPVFLTIGYLIFEIFLVLGHFTSFASTISEVFGKDESFSNRTDAWLTSMLYIAKNPVFGTGVLGDADATKLLGSEAFVNAHNQIIDYLLVGGLVLVALLLGVIIYIMVMCAKSKNKVHRREHNIAALFMLALLVEATFEVVTNSNAFWIILLVLNYICNESDRERYLEQETDEYKMNNYKGVPI